MLSLDEYVSDRHAGAETHLLIRWPARTVFGDGILDRDGALDGVDRTGEVGDDAVAGAAKDPPAMSGDALVENGAAGGQPAQGANLVLTHQPAVACDIGREDRRELADGFFFLAHGADKADPFAVRGTQEALFF